MTEEALMRIIADELRRPPMKNGSVLIADDHCKVKEWFNLRELARAILAAPDLQTVHIPKYDLTKDKLP